MYNNRKIYRVSEIRHDIPTPAVRYCSREKILPPISFHGKRLPSVFRPLKGIDYGTSLAPYGIASPPPPSTLHLIPQALSTYAMRRLFQSPFFFFYFGFAVSDLIYGTFLLYADGVHFIGSFMSLKGVRDIVPCHGFALPSPQPCTSPYNHLQHMPRAGSYTPLFRVVCFLILAGYFLIIYGPLQFGRCFCFISLTLFQLETRFMAQFTWS